MAKLGHRVVSVDANPTKVAMINRGECPVVEAGLPDLIAKANRSGNFVATDACRSAVIESDLAFVCVGTPSQANQSISLDFVRRVSQQIGEALRDRSDYYVVAIRSTVLPGTVENEIIPLLEKHSGKKAGRDFGVCMVPSSFGKAPRSMISFIPEVCRRRTRRAVGRPIAEIFTPRRPDSSDSDKNRRNGQIRRQRVSRTQSDVCE